MRSVRLALATALAVLVVLAGCGDDDQTAADDATTTTETSTTAAAEDDDTPSSTTGPPIAPTAIDTDYTGGDGPRVAILGDSITVQSLPTLRTALPDAAIRAVAVTGEGFAGGGWSTRWGTQVMLDAAVELGATDPDIAVVALGTNDAWTPDGTLPAALEAIDQIAADLGDTCLVAVLVDEDPQAEDFDTEAAAEINRRVRAVADHVVDWGAVADEPGLLYVDGIHLTVAGEERWSDEVAAGVEACPA